MTLNPQQFSDYTSEKKPLDPYYNEVPETQGTRRLKGTFNGPTGRELADMDKQGAYASSTHAYSSGCLACVRGEH